MTPIAITFLILAIAVVWGGLIASTLYLRRRPERTTYPRATPMTTARTTPRSSATPDHPRPCLHAVQGRSPVGPRSSPWPAW